MIRVAYASIIFFIYCLRYYSHRLHCVQVTKSPKPVASCAMPAGPGMDIKTDTPLVKKAREGVMEFLLVFFADCSHYKCNPLLLQLSAHCAYVSNYVVHMLRK